MLAYYAIKQYNYEQEANKYAISFYKKEQITCFTLCIAKENEGRIRKSCNITKNV